MADVNEIKKWHYDVLENWIDSCRSKKGNVSRNTVAIGIVVLHHLLNACPVSKDAVVSPRGEIKSSRGERFRKVLIMYGIEGSYLKEVTTRQAHQDGQRLFEAFEWGQSFLKASEDERKNLIVELINTLVGHAQDWLTRQNLKLEIDRRQSPATWVHAIVENARSRSGGIVEQHLIGAKLERRFTEMEISNHPAHAADRQTARDGDFRIHDVVYHITATPGRSVVRKCADNIKVGLHPLLLIPKDQEYKARALAEEEGIDKFMGIVSIEDFVALNIIELAVTEDKPFFGVLQEIVEIYNRRLALVETDLSLQIEVH